jgi:hypothetical protein
MPRQKMAVISLPFAQRRDLFAEYLYSSIWFIYSRRRSGIDVKATGDSTMRLVLCPLVLLIAAADLHAITMTADLSGVRPGPVSVARVDSVLQVAWMDDSHHRWQAGFALDSTKPVIAGFTVDGRTVIEGARPVYRCSTGKRTGGWDQFFDHPPLAAEGTRGFRGQFAPTAAVVKTVGDRVEVAFDGMRCGTSPAS